MKNLPYVLLVVLCLFCSGMFLKEFIPRMIDQNRFEALQNQVAAGQTDSPQPATGATTTDPSDAEEATLANGMLKKYAPLYAQNADFAGWVQIDDTRINYPVMQTKEDEEFYLHRNFEQNYSISGTPFLSASCTPDAENNHTILYGHHMKNGTMFSDLMRYKDEAFLKEHARISFDTLYKTRTFEVFAVFPIDVAELNDHFQFYNYTGFNSEASLSEFVEEIAALSLYPVDNPPAFGDKLLSLVTCDASSGTHRFVVMAKQVDPD